MKNYLGKFSLSMKRLSLNFLGSMLCCSCLFSVEVPDFTITAEELKKSVERRAQQEEELTYTLVEKTKIPGFEHITYFVRLPNNTSYDFERKSLSQTSTQVRGVLALCNWDRSPERAKLNIMNKNGRYRHFLEFADDNNLALITWTNLRGYDISKSADEMDKDQIKAYDSQYEHRVREWRHGYRRLCRRFNFPEKNLLIYGLSGGGQMAHRLALQEPDLFFGVHIHVNSSYDQIRRNGERVLWLVTTGTQEYGYVAGVRFYREAIRRGYHMIFHAEENLGHSQSEVTKKLSLAFFEYCLKFLPDPSDPNWKAPPVDPFYLMRYPTYVGDLLNGEAFPRESAAKYMSPEVMVALPTQDVAEAWGTILDLD